MKWLLILHLIAPGLGPIDLTLRFQDQTSCNQAADYARQSLQAVAECRKDNP